MSYARAGMTAYKKTSPGTTVEVADGNILSVDGFRTLQIDPDQPRHTTKLVRIGAVTHESERSRDMLPTLKAVKQWEEPRTYYRMKADLGFLREKSLVFNFCPRKGLF